MTNESVDAGQRDGDRPRMTERDHANMTAFVGHVLDLYRDGEIPHERASETLCEVMTFLEQGELHRALAWFEQGRKIIRRGE